ncbi:MAG: hypothetical protein ABEJ61_07005 [Haloferacaceae archaeon]
MPECTEEGCERPAGVLLRLPRADDRLVCVAHARGIARRDGVVAEPVDEEAWSYSS